MNSKMLYNLLRIMIILLRQLDESSSLTLPPHPGDGAILIYLRLTSAVMV
jgi:hypothetical protein